MLFLPQLIRGVADTAFPPGCVHCREIVDTDGYLVLRRIEQALLLKLSVTHHVIATGGSAVYSQAAMEHLKTGGIVVFLDADLQTLESRVKDFGTRGLAKRIDQSFSELFDERRPLYQKYADITIKCSGFTHEEVSTRIVDAVL